jgi:uncharacterized protein (DUF2249 family)
VTDTGLPTIDVRTIPPRERHPRIFGTFESLAPGTALEVVADHEPKHLRMQFEAMYPQAFTWDLTEAGPWVYRVRIERTA